MDGAGIRGGVEEEKGVICQEQDSEFLFLKYM
jgi:hypothetical protein